MDWRWVERRRRTIALVGFFVVWYLVQVVVAVAFGTETAVWWFYFTGDISPGHLLAPLSHNIADIGHLRRNATVLLIAGGLAEPYLEVERYVATLLSISLVSILIANVLSLRFGTPWALAGPSGGIYGLWAYIGVRNRSLVLSAGGWREQIEGVLALAGILTLVFVPLFDAHTTGAVNVSHAVGIVLGYGLALVETPPQTRR